MEATTTYPVAKAGLGVKVPFFTLSTLESPQAFCPHVVLYIHKTAYFTPPWTGAHRCQQ